MLNHGEHRDGIEDLTVRRRIGKSARDTPGGTMPPPFPSCRIRLDAYTRTDACSPEVEQRAVGTADIEDGCPVRDPLECATNTPSLEQPVRSLHSAPHPSRPTLIGAGRSCRSRPAGRASGPATPSRTP